MGFLAFVSFEFCRVAKCKTMDQLSCSEIDQSAMQGISDTGVQDNAGISFMHAHA